MDILNSIKTFFLMFSFEDYLLFLSVIMLIILIVSLVYLIKFESYKTDDRNELELITAAIKNEHTPKKIEFSTFEKEQEEEAIISYDELLKNSKNYELNYIDETKVDELTIKKVDSREIFVEQEQEEEFLIEI